MDFTENAIRIQNEFKAKLKTFIIDRIEESEKELKNNDTSYEDVLDCQDSAGYGETGENNNFSAGRIGVLKELQKEFNI